MYAQYVKNTMEPLNIPDVTKDTRFPWTVSNLILDLMLTDWFQTHTYRLLAVCRARLETGCLRGKISVLPAQGRDGKEPLCVLGRLAVCFRSILWIVTNQHVQVEVI